MLVFPEYGTIQLVNCISCSTKVNGNSDQLCGALLQSSSKIYFLIFLLIFVPLIPQELSQFYCITCFDTWDVIFSTVLEVFFLPQEADGKNCFHAEQMCPDFLCFCLGFATVCYPRIKTPLQRLMIRATSLFPLQDVSIASLSLFSWWLLSKSMLSWAAVGWASSYATWMWNLAFTINNLLLVILFLILLHEYIVHNTFIYIKIFNFLIFSIQAT